MNRFQRLRILIPIGFTAILVAYFLTWLPQPVAGLSFIGLEMGEWVKFLPQLSAGEITANRNFFYIPPITLGLMMIAWTQTWSDRRWQTWLVRLLAVAIAFLSFPSIEAILDEPASEWLMRLVAVMFVLVAAFLSPLFKRFSPGILYKGSWIFILVLGLIGAMFPSWAYLAIRGIVGELLRRDVGIGSGLWLNAAGHILIVVLAVAVLFPRTGKDPKSI